MSPSRPPADALLEHRARLGISPSNARRNVSLERDARSEARGRRLTSGSGVEGREPEVRLVGPLVPDELPAVAREVDPVRPPRRPPLSRHRPASRGGALSERAAYPSRVRVFSAPVIGALVVFASLAACGGPDTPDLRVEAASTTAAPTQVAAPRVVALDPSDGATEIDPTRGTLSATFDREMDRDGWAWVVESDDTAPELGESSWDTLGRTNTVVARLEPGRTYVLWINSAQFDYFKDLAGTPATPRRWVFSTSGRPSEKPGAATEAPPRSDAPRVVAFDPPDGASDVDPALDRLAVTFDREMGEGWSWVLETRELFPQTTGAASMSPDRRHAYLPVRLEPGRSYIVWLNSSAFEDFRDTEGRPLPPRRWTFTTRAAP